MDTLRRSTLTLHVPSALATGVGQVTFTAMQRMRVSQAQLGLSDTGTGAGNTTAVVKVNGTQAASLSIAGAAAAKSLVQTLGGLYPGGVMVQPGDLITVDITALPATTSPKAANVYLEVTQIDV